MARKDCPPGFKWDNLCNDCIQVQVQLQPPSDTRPQPRSPPIKPTTESPLPVVVPLRSTDTAIQADSLLALSPALWVSVAATVAGSSLALALWFFIYRRHARHRHTDDAEPAALHSPANAGPSVKIQPPSLERNACAGVFHQATTETPPPPPLCPHVNGGVQKGVIEEHDWGRYATSGGPPQQHGGAEGASGGPPQQHGGTVGASGGLVECSTFREHRIPLPATELGYTALVTAKSP